MTVHLCLMCVHSGAVHNYGYVVTPFHSSRDVMSSRTNHSLQSRYRYEFTSQLIKQQLSQLSQFQLKDMNEKVPPNAVIIDGVMVTYHGPPTGESGGDTPSVSDPQVKVRVGTETQYQTTGGSGGDTPSVSDPQVGPPNDNEN